MLALVAASVGVVPNVRAAETWLGNGNVAQGGLVRRVQTFGTNPNTIFAPIYGSGVYRTTDAGANWAAINTGLTNKFVNTLRNTGGGSGSSLATTTLYVATNGGGVFRTSAASINWTPFNSGLNCLYIENLQVASANLLYAATSCGVSSGVYRSSGPSAPWVQLNTGANGMPTNITVNTVDVDSTGTFLRATTEGQGVYYSGDGGATWTQINGTNPNVLSGPNGLVMRGFNTINATTGDVAAIVEGAGVFRTADNGTNWFPSSSGLPSLVTMGGIYNVSGSYYVALPGFGIYTSPNASEPWSLFPGATHSAVPYSRALTSTNAYYYASTLAGVYRGTGGPTTWTAINNGLPGGDINQSATNPSNPSIVYASADTIYKSTDGGNNWARSDTGFIGPANNVWLDYADPTQLYATSQHFGVFRSTNSGATWVQSNSGLASVVGQGTRMWINRATPSTIYLSQEGGGGVYRSLDSGATWSNISGNLTGKGLEVRRVRNDPTDSNILYAATGEGFYKSVNGGTSWTLVFQQISPASITQSVNHVTFDPTNPNTVFIATKNSDAFGAPFSFSGVWKSVNGGANWTQVLSNHLVHNLAVVGGGTSPLIVYAGSHNQTNGGILRSVDGGTNWSAFNSGLANTLVHSFERNSTYTQMLRASTYGGTYSLSGAVDAAVLNDVQAALDSFRNIVNTQGVNLDYTHFYPGMYDAGYLDEGKNALADAQHLASEVRGLTINSITINKVNSYDAVNGIIDVAATLVTSQGTFVIDSSLNDNGNLIFKDQGGGIYKNYGNQQLARVQARFETENRQTGQTCPSGCDGAYYLTQFQVDAPAGTVTAVSVNGPNYSNSSLVFNGTQTETIFPSPSPAPGVNVSKDQFTLMPAQSPTLNFPPVGSQYTFTITPATGPQQQVTRTVNPWTTETISITSPTGHSLAAANLGGALTVNWTLPTTFTVTSAYIYVNTSSSAGTCNGALNIDNIPPNATSYTISPMPTQCLGQPIADGAQTYPVQVNVAVTGTNGEATRVWYAFGNSVCTGNSGPTNLIATGVVQTQVQLQWNGACMPTTIANYGVYRGTAPGGPYTFIGNPVNPNTSTVFFNDTTVSPSTTYYYVVNATDVASNVSANSNELTVTTSSCPGADCISPSIPTNVVATAAGSNQVNLTWTASTDNVGVTKYQIGRNGSYINFNAPATPSYTDFTAQPGTTYGYFVSACDAAGNCSVGSNVSTVTTPAASTVALQTFGGPIAVEEGGTATFGTYLLKADNTTVQVNATWSGGSPASISPSGVLTVGPSAVSANTGTTLTATFSDPVLTGGQTLTVNRAVIIQDGTDHWVGNNQPGQGGDIRQILTINDGSATTLVALVYGRGVWRSTNNGANWLPANIGIGERQVRSATLLPDGTNNTLVLATESGVYRSVTRGGSWTSSNTGLTCTSGRVISRKDASVVYLGTNNCGVYKSVDGGMTWGAVNNGLPASAAIVSISVSSSSDFVAVGVAGTGVYRSLDGGANWTAINNGLITGPHGVLVPRILTDPSFYLAAVEGSGVFRTTNGGTSWNPVSGIPTGKSYGPFQRVGTDIYVGADGVGTFKSVDSGLTWAQITVTGVGSRRTGPIPDPNVAGTLYFQTAAGIYKSVDSGTTWSKSSSGLPGGFTHSTSTDPNDPNIIVATADTIHRSTDGGTTWSVSNTGLTGHTAISPGTISGFINGGSLLRNAAGLFVSTTNYGVFKSTDNGVTWFSVHGTMPVPVGQGVLLRADATNTSGLFAVYQNYGYGAYRTSDGGATWQSINGDLSGNGLFVRFVAADPNAAGTLYAATRAGLHKSVNSGTNWTLLPNTSTCTPNRVRVDAGTNPSTIYWSANCGESNTASGLYRIDGGGTQTQLLSFEPIFDLRVVRPGGVLTLWVSTHKEPGYFTSAGSLTWVGRVMRSTDGGTTFQGINAGITPVRPRAFEVNSTGSLVRVNTGGAGIYTLATAADILAPTVPGSFTATAVSSSQINLGWSASTDAVGVTAYHVFRGGVQIATLNSSTLAYNDTGLAASSLYNYGVRACDAAGNCSTQATASATTQAAPDTTAPTVPGSFTATAVSSSQINLAWTSSTDAVGVTAYHVFRGGVQIATLNSSTLAYNDTGLAASTLYNYGVRACDAAGNCSTQASASATTPAAGSANFTPLLRRGWNLMGNSLELMLNVAAIFGSPGTPVSGVTEYVNSIWKWNATLGLWQFYAPSLTAQGNQDYADLNGFEVLTSIEPGYGYWVNLKNTAPVGGITLPPQTGAPVIYESADPIGGTPAKIAGRTLVTGWQLVAIADPDTPSVFNEALSGTTPQPTVVKLSFQSLWAWDALLGTWYFYSPQLHKDGVEQDVGLALVKAYADNNGFLHFEDYDKTLGIGTGFWIRK